MLVKRVVKIIEKAHYEGLTNVNDYHFEVIDNIKSCPEYTIEYVEDKIVKNMAMDRITSVIISSYYLHGKVNRKKFLKGYSNWLDTIIELELNLCR